MRSILVIIVVICSLNDAFAQLRHPIYSDWTNGYSVGAYGRYQVGTNAITSNLLFNVYNGNALPRNQRERVSNYLTKKNRVGVDLDYGIFAKHIPDSTKGVGWFLNIADRTHAHGTYSKDLLDLLMFGNAMFAGETADFSNLRLSFLGYKQFEIGIIKQVSTSTGKWNIGFGASLLTGNQNLDVSIEDASLYTDADGEYLDGNISGQMNSSSLSSGQYFDANGLGFSASFAVGYEAEKFGVSLQGDDLGFVSWNQHLKRTEISSTFRFEGVELDLFTSGGGFDAIDLDSIADDFTTEKEGKQYTSTLAGRIRIEGYYNLNQENWKLYAGVQYRIAPSYFPYIFVGTSSPLPKGFFIDGRFAYGGFGSWHVGLEVKKRFANVFEIRLGTNNLEGYVLPMFGTSQSAYVSFAGFF